MTTKIRFLIPGVVSACLACAGAPDEEAVSQAELVANLGRALGIAQRYSAAQFAIYANGTHDWDDIQKGRINPPADSSALTQELLGLVADTPSYSEAILLLRVAGQDLNRPPPPVPASLSTNPNDLDWEFAGRNVPLPYAVQLALVAKRKPRDAALDQLTDQDFARLDAQESQLHLSRRREAALALGWRFDARDDLYVAALEDGDIWRRKKPAGYVPSDVNEEPGSSLMPPGEIPDELRTGSTGIRKKILGNTDSRELRSRFNGFSMGGAAWEPKGAIVDTDRTTDEVPVEVDCSGTKIRERLVATAGHCVILSGFVNDNTKWIPGADGVDAELSMTVPNPNGFKNSQFRIVRGPWFDHEWGNYDFALLVLHDNSSSCTLHWHGWRKRSGLTNDSIHVYGYPDEPLECSASPIGDDLCHGSIYGDGGTISYAGAYRLRYAIDTQPGQSGSAIYEIDDGDRFVLGTHRGEWTNSTNEGIRINDGNRDMINDAKADHPPTACD